MHTADHSQAPSLYDIPRHRLERARHVAANRATIALFRHQTAVARMWLQVIADVDSELNRVEAA